MRRLVASVTVVVGLLVCLGPLPVAQVTVAPQVLFDEAHNNFHTLGASYAPFARLLEDSGFAVSSLRSGVTTEALASADVFISVSALPAPRDELARQARAEGQVFRLFEAAGRAAFSDAEVDTFRVWVQAGGGLLLVVDHPPYAAAARSLVAAFGADVRNATAADPGFRDSEFPAGIVFARQDGRISDHPATIGVERVVTVAGASLTPPSGGTVLLRLSNDAVDRHGMPDTPGYSETSAANRGQAIAFEYGAGRVVIVGEAGMFAASPGSNMVSEGTNGILRSDLTTARFAVNIAQWLAGLSVE